MLGLLTGEASYDLSTKFMVIDVQQVQYKSEVKFLSFFARRTAVCALCTSQ